MTGHKQKVNILLNLDLFPFLFVLDYHLVEGFSRTQASLDVLKINEAVFVDLLQVYFPQRGACSVV